MEIENETIDVIQNLVCHSSMYVCNPLYTGYVTYKVQRTSSIVSVTQGVYMSRSGTSVHGKSGKAGQTSEYNDIK